MKRSGSTRAGDQVVVYVRGLIESGGLHSGDRLPTERELASRLGVSRPTVRAGLRKLSTLGVVRSRRGSGTFITDGPPVLGSEPLSFLAALHGFTRDEMYESPPDPRGRRGGPSRRTRRRRSCRDDGG